MVSLAYGAVGGVWIIFSDRWLAHEALATGVDWLPLEMVKGLLFVATTAIALYALMRWGLLRWRQVEMQVRNAESRMRTVVQTMPSALVVLNAAGICVYANQHAQTVLGLGIDAILGMRFDDERWAITRLDGSAMPREELPFAEAQRSGSPVTGSMHCIEPSRGQRRVLSVNASPLFTSLGEVAGVVAIIHDMTAQQQSAQDTARTSRALHALADMSAFGMQARSAQEILDYACAALAEHAVCVLCWIGTVEADATRSITPVATAGGARAYVDALRVTWDSSDTGQGPAGRAVRSRKPVVASRLGHDEGFAVWQEAALQQGFVSAFAIPMLDPSGSPIKILCGYERVEGAFQQAECEVLFEFTQRVGLALRTVRARLSLEEQDLLTYNALQGSIRAVQRMVEARDPYTHGHEERVARLSVAIADVLGFPKEQRMAVEIAAKLHDVGKLMVPAEILAKPTRLTKPEFELIKGHVEAGYDILKEIDFGLPVAEIMRQHHERLDGSGYPIGLREQQIRLESRVLAVADVAESMLSHRPYRPARTFADVEAELRKGRGKSYDADAVDACLGILTGPESPLRV